MVRKIPKYYDYELIGRTRMDAMLALANSNSVLIARGLIDGASVVNKFGGGCEAAADTETDAWDDGATQPVYPWPTSALITDLSQDADQVAMRGATIQVQGLDTNWALVVQDRTLDASDTSTPVELATPLRRIFRMKVQANVVGDSNIVAHNAADNVDYAIVQAGNNQTLMSLYTVPLGKVALMSGYYASVVNETAANKTPVGTEVKLFAADRNAGYEFQLKHATAIAENGANEHHVFDPPYRFTQKTDIKIQMRCIKEPGHIHAGFDLKLFDA